MTYNANSEFTVTLKSGKVVTAEVEVTVVNESGYGADADGRRGQSMTFIEDAFLTCPISEDQWAMDDNDNLLTNAERVEAEQLLLEAASEYDWNEDRRGNYDER